MTDQIAYIKKAAEIFSGFSISLEASGLGQSIHMLRQAAFQVSHLVFVNDVVFGKLVQHRESFIHQACGLCLVGRSAHTLNPCAGGFMLILVSQVLGFVAANALQG